MPTRHILIALSVAVAGATASITAQQPQPPPQSQQPPAFRSAVDLVPVDVNIVDNTGRPVTGLTAADFTLTVDGKPRRIASAEFVSAVRETAAAAPAQPTDYSSNATAGGGRLIMLVVDQGNIGVGRGRVAMEAAKRFIAKLSPADRVGLVTIPAGRQIDFTANHSLVTSMLTTISGQASSTPSQYRVGVAEAFRIQRGDLVTTTDVVRRECANQDPTVCSELVIAEARMTYALTRERSRASMLALRSVMDRMAQTTAPKTVVLISEGLTVEREHDELTWIGPTASRGQVVLYVLQLDEPYFDASESRPSPTRREDLSLAEEGLSMMAGFARGTLMRVVASPDPTFNRLALEMSAYYLLSFEPEPSDRDGKTHKIKVGLQQRLNAEIRSRSEFSIAPTAAASNTNLLADTLKTPIIANDIPLKLSTYTLREPASDKLRILLVAEIDRTRNADGHLALGLSLTNDADTKIRSQMDPEVKTPIDPVTKTQIYTGFINSETPGLHTLKIAVVDDQGRRGSVEHTFRAALTSIGQIRATDLLINEHQHADSEGVTPVVGRELTSGMMHGYIELYSEAPEALNNATILFEIAQNEQGRALDGASGRMSPPSPDAPQRRSVEGSVPLALLPPGEYVARAVVMIDGRKVGQVSRPLRVGRTAMAVAKPTTTLGLRPAGSRGTPIAFSSRIERFERGSVLAPQVVGFFLDRLNFGARGEADAGPAIEHARAGRFDDAVKALGTGGSTLPATFLSGLALYSKGELEPAANKFRETLRMDSEFFPAAFYLGSCYAAGGRDQEAVGAWQLSLVTESDAPFIFTLLGDALIRLRESDHALEILNEAAGVWPDNEEVQIRLGAVFALAGKRADALLKLEPYLAKHPDDVDRHFLALKTLYEARAEGKPIRSKEEDKALFAKWAKAYASAKGPQQALVDQWAKAISR